MPMMTYYRPIYDIFWSIQKWSNNRTSAQNWDTADLATVPDLLRGPSPNGTRLTGVMGVGAALVLAGLYARGSPP
jgi:hypothetical protein